MSNKKWNKFGIFSSHDQFIRRNTQCGSFKDLYDSLNASARQKVRGEFFIPIDETWRETWWSHAPKWLSERRLDIVRYKEFSRMYDLFSAREYNTIARNITNARLVNPKCTELKRIAFEIGNAFGRLVTRPGYRRTSITKTSGFSGATAK